MGCEEQALCTLKREWELKGSPVRVETRLNGNLDNYRIIATEKLAKLFFFWRMVKKHFAVLKSYHIVYLVLTICYNTQIGVTGSRSRHEHYTTPLWGARAASGLL